MQPESLGGKAIDRNFLDRYKYPCSSLEAIENNMATKYVYKLKSALSSYINLKTFFKQWKHIKSIFCLILNKY